MNKNWVPLLFLTFAGSIQTLAKTSSVVDTARYDKVEEAVDGLVGFQAWSPERWAKHRNKTLSVALVMLRDFYLF